MTQAAQSRVFVNGDNVMGSRPDGCWRDRTRGRSKARRRGHSAGPQPPWSMDDCVRWEGAAPHAAIARLPHRGSHWVWPPEWSGRSNRGTGVRMFGSGGVPGLHLRREVANSSNGARHPGHGVPHVAEPDRGTASHHGANLQRTLARFRRRPRKSLPRLSTSRFAERKSPFRTIPFSAAPPLEKRRGSPHPRQLHKSLSVTTSRVTRKTTT